MMSFNSDYNEVQLLLHITEVTVTQNCKMIREILDRMKKQYEQRVWEVQQDGDGDKQ